MLDAVALVRTFLTAALLVLAGPALASSIHGKLADGTGKQHAASDFFKANDGDRTPGILRRLERLVSGLGCNYDGGHDLDSFWRWELSSPERTLGSTSDPSEPAASPGATTTSSFPAAICSKQRHLKATRGLTAADVGLSRATLRALEGTDTNAGTTRILRVENIAGNIPTGEIRGALQRIVGQARAEGVKTLQIEGRFANEALQRFVNGQAERLGGSVSSSGGIDTLTFILGR